MIQELSVPLPAAFPAVQQLLELVSVWSREILEDAFAPRTLWQLSAVVVAAGIGYLLSRIPRKRLMAMAEARGRIDFVLLAIVAVLRMLWPAFTVLILFGVTALFEAAGLGSRTLHIAISLLVAVLAVQMATSSMKLGWESSSLAIFLSAFAAL